VKEAAAFYGNRPLWRLDVAGRWLSEEERRDTVFHQDVFLAGKGDENAPRRFCVDISDQSGFACAYRRFLLRAIATPFHGELIGIGNCV